MILKTKHIKISLPNLIDPSQSTKFEDGCRLSISSLQDYLGLELKIIYPDGSLSFYPLYTSASFDKYRNTIQLNGDVLGDASYVDIKFDRKCEFKKVKKIFKESKC